MLKRSIKYIDFNDKEVAEDFYFNISKAELVRLEAEVKGGMGEMLQTIIAAEDNDQLVKMFERILLLAYGQKSEDGKRFIKSDALREEFSQTAAYQELFMELLSSDTAAIDFLRGVMPKDMLEGFNKAVAAVPDTTTTT